VDSGNYYSPGHRRDGDKTSTSAGVPTHRYGHRRKDGGKSQTKQADVYGTDSHHAHRQAASSTARTQEVEPPRESSSRVFSHISPFKDKHARTIPVAFRVSLQRGCGDNCEEQGGTEVPKKGEKGNGYCKKYQRETEWIYVNWVLQTFWISLRGLNHFSPFSRVEQGLPIGSCQRGITRKSSQGTCAYISETIAIHPKRDREASNPCKNWLFRTMRMELRSLRYPRQLWPALRRKSQLCDTTVKKYAFL
jgi:hypothetical protein